MTKIIFIYAGAFLVWFGLLWFDSFFQIPLAVVILAGLIHSIWFPVKVFRAEKERGETVAFPASRSVHRPRDCNTVSASSGLEGQDRSSPFCRSADEFHKRYRKTQAIRIRSSKTAPLVAFL